MEYLPLSRRSQGLWSLGVLLALGACKLGGRTFNDADDTKDAAEVPKRYLYVASGACYAGGVTPAAGNGLISKYDLETGALLDVVADFNRTATADFPADIQEFDKDYLAVLVENATTPTYRRIDLVPKDGGHYPSTLTYGGGTFTGVLRSLALLDDDSTLVSRSAAIAKFNSNYGVTGANFINAPAGLCATSTVLMSDIVELSSGHILFAHAAATPNNRLGVMSADGTTCATGIAGPITTALPTDLLIHSSGHILAAFGSTVAASNVIYSYSVDATGSTISGVQSYTNSAYVNGPTRMAEDPETGDVYIANGLAALSNVEKFHYNKNTMTLTRAQAYPFIPLSGSTRCVSGMVITE